MTNLYEKEMSGVEAKKPETKEPYNRSFFGDTTFHFKGGRTGELVITVEAVTAKKLGNVIKLFDDIIRDREQKYNPKESQSAADKVLQDIQWGKFTEAVSDSHAEIDNESQLVSGVSAYWALRNFFTELSGSGSLYGDVRTPRLAQVKEGGERLLKDQLPGIFLSNKGNELSQNSGFESLSDIFIIDENAAVKLLDIISKFDKKDETLDSEQVDSNLGRVISIKVNNAKFAFIVHEEGVRSGDTKETKSGKTGETETSKDNLPLAA